MLFYLKKIIIVYLVVEVKVTVYRDIYLSMCGRGLL